VGIVVNAKILGNIVASADGVCGCIGLKWRRAARKLPPTSLEEIATVYQSPAIKNPTLLATTPQVRAAGLLRVMRAAFASFAQNASTFHASVGMDLKST
jgi:hypothetical protein